MGVWLEMLGPGERSSTRDELVRYASVWSALVLMMALLGICLWVVVCLLVL